jgi:hypothetical protein
MVWHAIAVGGESRPPQLGSKEAAHVGKYGDSVIAVTTTGETGASDEHDSNEAPA